MKLRNIKRSLRKAAACFLVFCVLIMNVPTNLTAGPQGQVVRYGNVTFRQQGNTWIITQGSRKAIVDYSSFNVALKEIINFRQPGASASILNRILSANPTMLNGTINANGQVYFINPAGVIIGAGARINTAKFVASGLNMKNEDFIKGIDKFQGGHGEVVNRGSIAGKSVYLIGKKVTNLGSIDCPEGYIVMAAGDSVFVGKENSDVIVEVGTFSVPEGATAEQAAVTNAGVAEAAGGQIVLAAGDNFSRAIENTGTLSASVDVGQAGGVKLAAAGGLVSHKGTIEAKSADGKGGKAEVLGEKVLLQGASVDVSGSDGGGVILVGGDYQGKGDTQTAKKTYVDKDTTLRADAAKNGDGGKIITWADQDAWFYGSASAKGGAEGGDGGFIEISGKKGLAFAGSVNTRAPKGKTGTTLFDPDNIVIHDQADGPQGALLPDPFVAGFPGSPGDFDIAETDLENLAADTSIALIANNNLTINKLNTDNVLDLTQPVTSGNSITMQADNDVVMKGKSDTIRTGGGGITMQAGNDLKVGRLESNGGDVSLQGDNSLIAYNNLDAGMGSVTATSPDMQLNGNIEGLDVTLNGNANLTNAATQTIDAGIGRLTADKLQKNNGSLALKGQSGIDVDGDVNVTNGTLDVDNTADFAGNVTADAVDFKGAVTADGAGDQKFEATGQKLIARSTITRKNAGTLDVKASSEVWLYGDVTAQDAGGNLKLSSYTEARKGGNQVIDATGGTLTTEGELKKTNIGSGSLVLGGDSGVTLKDNVTVDTTDLIVKDDATVAAGKELRAAGNFEASKSKLTGQGDLKVTAVAGDATLEGGVETQAGGKFDVNAGNNINIKEGDINAGGDAVFTANAGAGKVRVSKGADIEADNVTLDGGLELLGNQSQTIYARSDGAGTGVLLARSTIGDTAGNPYSAKLTLKGDTKVQLDDNVDLRNGPGSLEIDGPAEVGANLFASDITVKSDLKAAGTGANADQTFEAGNDMRFVGNADKTTGGEFRLKAGNDMIIEKRAAGSGNLDVIAGRTIVNGGAADIKAGNGADNELLLVQDTDLDLANLGISNKGNTHIGAVVKNGSFTADTGGANSADTFKSVQVSARGNVKLEGPGDINVSTKDFGAEAPQLGNGARGVLKSSAGGVSVNSGGTVKTDGTANLDNVDIEGFSDGVAGVDLPYGPGKAAVVLKGDTGMDVGAGTNITANGAYNNGPTDDRADVMFDMTGSPIDIAVYIAGYDGAGAGGDVDVAGTVNVTPGTGTVVFDAWNDVNIGAGFTAALPATGPERLEVSSRTTTTYEAAVSNNTLPFAAAYQATSSTFFGNPNNYILRGSRPLAYVLKPAEDAGAVESGAGPTPPLPNLPEADNFFNPQENTGPADAASWLAGQLAVANIMMDTSYMAASLEDAYILETDVTQDDAVNRLRNVSQTLRNADAIVTLAQVVNQYIPADAPPTEEQMAAVGQAIAMNLENNETYANASEWLDAMEEYVTIMTEEIGLTLDQAVAVAMGNYGPAEETNVAMYVQARLNTL